MRARNGLAPGAAGLRRAAGLIAFCVASTACSEEAPQAPPLEPDSGPQCERGTENCACTTSGRCDGPLLCVAGRCLASGSDPDPPEPPLMRPTLRPPRPDGGSDPLDASVQPDASVQLPDASVQPPADAAPPPESEPDASQNLDGGPG